MAAASKRPPTHIPRTTSPRKREEIGHARKRSFTRTAFLLDRLTNELIAIDAFAISLHALYALLARHDLLPRHLPRSGDTKNYSKPHLRYELRMKPFLPVALPEPVPFEVFEREVTLESDTDSAILDRAERAISEAKRRMENLLAGGAFLEIEKEDKQQTSTEAIKGDWTRDTKDALRSCIGTSVALATVKRAMQAFTPKENNSSAKETSDDEKDANTGHHRLNLSVEIPDIGSKARWHDWWVVPKVQEVKIEEQKEFLPMR